MDNINLGGHARSAEVAANNGAIAQAAEHSAETQRAAWNGELGEDALRAAQLAQAAGATLLAEAQARLTERFGSR